MPTFYTKFSVLLAYPASITKQRNLTNHKTELPKLGFFVIEGKDFADAVHLAQYNALMSLPTRQRKGLKAQDFRTVLVLDGHHIPAFIA